MNDSDKTFHSLEKADNKCRILFINGYHQTHFNYKWHFVSAETALPQFDVDFMSTFYLTHHRTFRNVLNYLRFMRRVLRVASNYDYLICHENTYSSRLTAMLKKLGFIREPKLVLVEFDIDMARGSRLRRLSIEWFTRLFYSSANLILASSEYQKEIYQEAQVFQNTRISYITSSLSDNRVDFLKARAESALLSPPKENYIFSVGQTNRDFPSLLAAARAFPEQQFIIMARQAAKDAPPNVTFVDWGTYENYINYLVEAKLIVLPLKAHKHAAGLTTLFEAWAVGKPVIVSDTDMIREYIGNEAETVLAYQPENYQDLIRSLKSALDYPESLEVVAQNGNAYLRENLTSQMYLNKLGGKLKQLSLSR